MAKRLCLIHTINKFMDMIYNPFAKSFAEAKLDVEIFNIMDDSLLADTLKAGELTNNVARRILGYVYSAEAVGADVCMVTYTSVNQAAAYARRFANIIVFNIDEPVARAAVVMGGRIGVLRTLLTSPGAIVRLVDEESARQGKSLKCITAVAT